MKQHTEQQMYWVVSQFVYNVDIERTNSLFEDRQDVRRRSSFARQMPFLGFIDRQRYYTHTYPVLSHFVMKIMMQMHLIMSSC